MGRVRNVVKCPSCRHPIRAYHLQKDWMYCPTCRRWICRKHPLLKVVECATCVAVICADCAKTIGNPKGFQVYACDRCYFRTAEKELST